MENLFIADLAGSHSEFFRLVTNYFQNSRIYQTFTGKGWIILIPASAGLLPQSTHFDQCIRNTIRFRFAFLRLSQFLTCLVTNIQSGEIIDGQWPH